MQKSRIILTISFISILLSGCDYGRMHHSKTIDLSDVKTTLLEVDGQVPLLFKNQKKEISLSFSKKDNGINTVSGFSGCSDFQASFDFKDGILSVGPITVLKDKPFIDKIGSLVSLSNGSKRITYLIDHSY